MTNKISGTEVANSLGKQTVCLLPFVAMNRDDKDTQDKPADDAYFEADYDEDTIDYDLDTDKLLEEESFELEQPEAWPNDIPARTGSPFDTGSGTSDKYYSENEQELDDDEEQWYDEEDEQNLADDDEYIDSWPLGLIAAGVFALLLLAAGGYGVLQQRTEMQEEVRQLRATLATTSSNTEIAASRQAQRGLESHNAELQAQLERLQQENQSLQLRLSKLESGAISRPPAPIEEAAPTPVKKADAVKSTPTPVIKPTPKPSAKPLPASNNKPASTGGEWFVNFSSYKQQDIADQWASKLKVKEGRVVVVSTEKAGTHYYRVRVIDLPNREIAGKIAAQLEQTYKLPRLWVGKQ